MKTKIPNRKAVAARKRAGKDAERKQFGTTVRIFTRDIDPIEAAKVLLSRSRHSSSSR